MIEVDRLSFAYDKNGPRVLKDLAFTVREGEYLAVIGPNGSGKTTMIRHLNALLLPSSGEVRINGLNTREKRNLLEVRRLVGMVFQNPDNQIVGMRVEEDVAFGPGNLGLPPAEIRSRVKQAIDMVGLGGMESRPPHTLSGGQKQLLALAGILAMNPRFIVLDEPTSSLDPAAKEQVHFLLRELHGQGLGIILVTQNMEEAAAASRIMVMQAGEIAADDTPDRILSRVDWMKDMGLAPPVITELMWELQLKGEAVKSGVFSVREALTEIETLLLSIRSRNGIHQEDRSHV